MWEAAMATSRILCPSILNRLPSTGPVDPQKDAASLQRIWNRENADMSTGAIKTAREQGRLAPLKLEHAVLRTTQLDPMVEWYKTVLEAEITFANKMIAFLSYDEQNHRIAIVARPGTVPRLPNSAGLDHLAFTYADLGELIATYERLKALEIIPVRSADHGSSTSMYYADPDGNQIELKVDTFGTPEEQHAWMRSTEFAANPIGSPFDPDQLAAQSRARLLPSGALRS
jgi:catechol-2,3-dioxygenase